MLYLLLLPALAATSTVRIMSFNIWHSGNNVNDGVNKIVKHIKIVNPDVVALQEVMTCNRLRNITDLLGNEWSGACPNWDYPDVAIITRHEIKLISQNKSTQAVGAEIRLKSGKTLNVWSGHFDTGLYGPEEIEGKPYLTKEMLMKQEINTTRVKQVTAVKESKVMQQMIANTDSVPLFFAGDFNSPSHLDWIESTKHLHKNWTFEWTPTKILADIGFKDSFREVHPDPFSVAQLAPSGSANTWSPVACKSETGPCVPVLQDRIDFVLYQGKVRPTKSYIYDTSEALKRSPDYKSNDYPSDHYAVITDFKLKCF